MDTPSQLSQAYVKVGAAREAMIGAVLRLVATERLTNSDHPDRVAAEKGLDLAIYHLISAVAQAARELDANSAIPGFGEAVKAAKSALAANR